MPGSTYLSSSPILSVRPRGFEAHQAAGACSIQSPGPGHALDVPDAGVRCDCRRVLLIDCFHPGSHCDTGSRLSERLGRGTRQIAGRASAGSHPLAAFASIVERTTFGRRPPESGRPSAFSGPRMLAHCGVRTKPRGNRSGLVPQEQLRRRARVPSV